MELRPLLLCRAVLLGCLLAASWPGAAQAEEGAAAPGLPRPAFLAAEPTPNDNGTHVTVRWPAPSSAAEGWRYVVYISLDPAWRWHECGTLGPEEGPVNSPAVSPFYPYRFSPGREQYHIVAPLEVPGMAVHYLPAEERLCKWLQESRATLQQCDSTLAALRTKIEERQAFLARAARYRAAWEERARQPGPEQETFAGYLDSAAERAKGMQEAIELSRDSLLEDLAQYLLLNALINAEAGHLTASLGVSDLDAARRQLDEMASALSPATATATAYDDYDRLRYVLHLAPLRQRLGATRAVGEDITGQVLYRLEQLTAEAGLPEIAPKDAGVAGTPENAAIGEALKRWHAALVLFERDPSQAAEKEWAEANESIERAKQQWQAGAKAALVSRLGAGALAVPSQDYLAAEVSRLRPMADACAKRLSQLTKEYNRRTYWFRLGLQTPEGDRLAPLNLIAGAAPRADLFDMAKLVNLVFAVGFAAALLLMVGYVRHHPDVFVRRIAGLEAVDEAIGRATEMGKPVLFVHGLTGVGDIALLASVNILGRLARQVAEYDSDLLVVNNDPLVFSLSQEVVQEAYLEAGRPDAYQPDNILMVASEQFPYAAAVAGTMARRRPAANFFMGYFYAEALILAEAGAITGAIQIAGTDSFTQLPFFITTCDYTLMGEELYAASAYLSRNARLLATLKAQDMGKALLLVSLPVGVGLYDLGLNWVRVIFTAYEKGF